VVPLGKGMGVSCVLQSQFIALMTPVCKDSRILRMYDAPKAPKAPPFF